MDIPLTLTLFHYQLSAGIPLTVPTDLATLQRVFSFFKHSALFNWKISHNFCDARAEAMSLVLEKAKVPHVKCWVMGAAFLHPGQVGGLKNYWNYHVAVAIPVLNSQQKFEWMVIDPSTADRPLLLEDWAAGITEYPHSYHFLKAPEFYIFPEKFAATHNWHPRGKRNFRWTMQGLMGIHALNPPGKAKLAFHKKRISNFTRKFFHLTSRIEGSMNA